MTNEPPISPLVEVLAERLEIRLVRELGPLLSGKALARALGYPSPQALRQAISRGTVPVAVFPIENRRGKFALAADVARWLAERRVTAGGETPAAQMNNAGGDERNVT